MSQTLSPLALNTGVTHFTVFSGGLVRWQVSISTLDFGRGSNSRLHIFFTILCFKHIWGDYNPGLYVVLYTIV